MIDETIFKKFPDSVKQAVWDGLEVGDKIHYFQPNDEQHCLFFDAKDGTAYIYILDIYGEGYTALTIDGDVRNKLAEDLKTK